MMGDSVRCATVTRRDHWNGLTHLVSDVKVGFVDVFLFYVKVGFVDVFLFYVTALSAAETVYGVEQ
jgi:hypothetical protein